MYETRQAVSHLARQCAHAQAGHSCVTGTEAAKDDVEHASRCGERRIELNATEQRAEKLVDDCL